MIDLVRAIKHVAMIDGLQRVPEQRNIEADMEQVTSGIHCGASYTCKDHVVKEVEQTTSQDCDAP